MIVKKKIQIVSIFSSLIILCAGAIIFSELESEKQIKLSQTITPQTATIIQKHVISGNLYPIKEIDVKSSIPGILETYYVQIGDNVKPGDKIAKIKITTEPSQVERAKSSLKTAEFTFNKEKLDYERDKKLFDQQMISQSDFENVTKNYLISKEQYEYAKNQLYLLEQGFIPSSNISNVVLATASGTIIDLPLEEGIPVVERNNFRDGTTVATVARLDSFLFRGKIIEDDVLALRKGMPLKVIPASMIDYSTDAVVRKISPKGYWDHGTMKYDVEATFMLPDSIHIYSGFNATAEFILKEKANVLTVLESSLRFRNDSIFVELLTDGKFEMKYIETGISDRINIEVLKGLDQHSKIKK